MDSFSSEILTAGDMNVYRLMKKFFHVPIQPLDVGMVENQGVVVLQVKEYGGLAYDGARRGTVNLMVNEGTEEEKMHAICLTFALTPLCCQQSKKQQHTLAGFRTGVRKIGLEKEEV